MAVLETLISNVQSLFCEIGTPTAMIYYVLWDEDNKGLLRKSLRLETVENWVAEQIHKILPRRAEQYCQKLHF